MFYQWEQRDCCGPCSYRGTAQISWVHPPLNDSSKQIQIPGRSGEGNQAAKCELMWRRRGREVVVVCSRPFFYQLKHEHASYGAALSVWLFSKLTNQLRDLWQTLQLRRKKGSFTAFQIKTLQDDTTNKHTHFHVKFPRIHHITHPLQTGSKHFYHFHKLISPVQCIMGHEGCVTWRLRSGKLKNETCHWCFEGIDFGCREEEH